MSGNEIKTMTLTNSPAIHVGPIITPGTNETISIVIPLTAQITTLSKTSNESCEEYIPGTLRKQSKTINLESKEKKLKGCPFPNCCRYGRAFSRAHDLKRHIARHNIREEKLPGIRTSVTFDCNEHEINFIEDYMKSGDQQNQILPNNFETLFSISNKNSSQKLRIQPIVEKSKNNERINKDENYLIEDFLLLVNKSSNVSVTQKITDKELINKKTLGNKLRCDYCSKMFKTKWTLSSHVAAHEGRFQFKCNQCGKKFVRKSHFEGHVRSHEATRPYICDQCGKSFKELKHRREHTKRKHPAVENHLQTYFKKANFCISDKVTLDNAKCTILMPVKISL